MATVNDQAKSKKRRVFDFAREMKCAESNRQRVKNKTRIFLLHEMERWRAVNWGLATTTAKTDAAADFAVFGLRRQNKKKTKELIITSLVHFRTRNLTVPLSLYINYPIV